MKPELYRLAYFSRNAIGAFNLQIEIEKILAVARKRNAAADVTGALLYSNGCFAQVLEGAQAEVEIIFESILLDVRHRDIQIVHLDRTEQRSFADWSMAFAGLPVEGTHPLDVEGLMQSPDALRGGKAGLELVTVLHTMIGRQEEGTR